MNDTWRPALHLTPPKGWLNDPNGLCQFQGVYHVFFQYTPDNPEGGLKHWGHYISKDLLNWEFAGIPLSPREPFERCGVYSGSALVKEDQMHLFYTGNVKLDGDYNYITDGREGNTIHVSSENGLDFGERTCLLRNSDYPDHLTCHVRDPKVVDAKSIGEKEGDYMFLGARTKENVGQVLVYKSDDLKNWELANVLQSEDPLGYMWECPDAMMVGGKKLLSISPQGVETKGIDYQNLYQAGYYEVQGSFAGTYTLHNFKEWDRGFDFYAPQTFEDEKGRRLLIGWVGMPDVPEQTNPTVEDGWQNALTLVREVFVKDGKVMQYPVQELQQLRAEELVLEQRCYSKELSCYEVQIDNETGADLEITISGGLHLTYNKKEGLFNVFFDKESGLGYGREERNVRIDSCTRVNVFVDVSCIEVYINGGEEVFTFRFYTKTGKSSLWVSGKSCNVSMWELNQKLQ